MSNCVALLRRGSRSSLSEAAGFEMLSDILSLVGALGVVLLAWYLKRFDTRNTFQHGENSGVLNGIRTDILEVKTDVTHLRLDVGEIKGDIQVLKSDVKESQDRFQNHIEEGQT